MAYSCIKREECDYTGVFKELNNHGIPKKYIQYFNNYYSVISSSSEN